MSVIYTPPEPHHHEWPRDNVPPGTIGQCSGCHQYGEKRASKIRAGVSSWHVMGFGEVIWARLVGKIPPAPERRHVPGAVSGGPAGAAPGPYDDGI